MDITNKAMPEPHDSYNYVEHIIQFIKDIAPFGTATWVSYLMIKYVYKYKTEGREEAINKMIDARVSPEITDLKDSIERLTKSIGALERKITP